MREVLDIVFGVTGQTLFYDAPEGRPSSVVSVEVRKWDYGDAQTAELATTGSPSVETNPNTTTDAAAGATQSDPRRVPLTLTTGCAIERDFLLIGADGLKEWIDVAAITTADSIQARHPLHNDYASGASFVSTRMSIALSSTWIADLAKLGAIGPSPHYRVRWVYVVAGVTYVADTYFNLVRYGARHDILPENVDDMCPGWLTNLPTDHRVDQGRRLIADAFRVVKIDCMQIDLDDSSIADSDVVGELVRHKTIEVTEWARFLSSKSADESRHLAAVKKYTERLNAFVRLVNRTPIRDNSGGATKKKSSVGLTVR